MKRFQKYLQESFDRPYKYRWTEQDDDNWTGKFKTKDDTVLVEFFESGDGEWEVEFTLKDAPTSSPYQNSGKFDAFKILSTILVMIKEFISIVEPESLYFTGNKEDGKGKLYKVMVKKFQSDLKKLGYKVDVKDTPRRPAIEFYLRKNQ